MGLKAFNYGANIVAYQKNGRNYGMCCSWAMQVDYDKICMLLGEQSTTGKKLAIGEIIGVSSLSSNQKEIAFHFGEGHSDEIDKFKNIEYRQESSGIIIKGAKVEMLVEVMDIIRLKGIESDIMLYGKIIKYYDHQDLTFLTI